MNRATINLFLLLCFATLSEKTLGSDCSVSEPNIAIPKPFTSVTPGFGWFGDERLAALIPSDGVWQGMGAKYNFRNKFLWWEKGNSLSPKDGSKIEISAINLSDESMSIGPTYASNIYVGEDFSAWGGMLTVLEFPSAGCWRIVGWYKEHEIEFSVLVKDK